MELSFKPAALAQLGSATLQPEKLPSPSLSSPLEGCPAKQLAVCKDWLLTFIQGLKKEKGFLCGKIIAAGLFLGTDKSDQSPV